MRAAGRASTIRRTSCSRSPPRWASCASSCSGRTPRRSSRSSATSPRDARSPTRLPTCRTCCCCSSTPSESICPKPSLRSSRRTPQSTRSKNRAAPRANTPSSSRSGRTALRAPPRAPRAREKAQQRARAGCVRPACSGRSTDARGDELEPRAPRRVERRLGGVDDAARQAGRRRSPPRGGRPATSARAAACGPPIGVAAPDLARAPHAAAPQPARADLARRVGSLAEPDVAQVLHRQVVVRRRVGRRGEHERDRRVGGRALARVAERDLGVGRSRRNRVAQLGQLARELARASCGTAPPSCPRGRSCFSRTAFVSDARYETFTTIDENTASSSPRNALVRRGDPGAQRLELAQHVRRVPASRPRAGSRRAASRRSRTRARDSSVSLRARERKRGEQRLVGRAQRARATRTATGETSQPNARRPAARASTSTVPPPQNGSNTESPGKSAIRSRAASACMPAG